MSRKFARKDSKHPNYFGLEWGYTTAQEQPIARSEKTWSTFDMAQRPLSSRVVRGGFVQ